MLLGRCKEGTDVGVIPIKQQFHVKMTGISPAAYLSEKVLGFVYSQSTTRRSDFQVLSQARAPVTGPNPRQNKVVSGFQALRQARAPVMGLEPAKERSTEGVCRSQGRLAFHNTTDISLKN
ncbi:hypothetical protein PoB_005689400 [Plakobranchus ocellatus]|uniref:Uncharacterized protein n=1 Tax=Plakobranchus ocellatus TaxID=259542 RepID=A0AAV4CHV9_9GAST|nr:hypothetical protein PoB_005689400 [Plakobranchus ocellatus]